MGNGDKMLHLHANRLLFWVTWAHRAVLPLNPPPHTSGVPNIQQSHKKKKKQYKKTALSPFLKRLQHHPPAYFLSSVPSSPLGNTKILQKPQVQSSLPRKSEESYLHLFGAVRSNESFQRYKNPVSGENCWVRILFGTAWVSKLQQTSNIKSLTDMARHSLVLLFPLNALISLPFLF